MTAMTDTLDGSERRIGLVRPTNMRELGGIPAAAGRFVRRGLVYRAGGLHQLGEPDIATVSALGIGTLVDLRTFKELEAHGVPDARLAPDRRHLPMIPDVWDLRPLDEGEPLEDYFCERYEEMLDHGQPAIATTLALLSGRHGDRRSLAYFCAAGKDRTGVMTAVLLRLLEVDDETIVADYVLSGPEVARLIEQMGDRERWTSERMGGGGPPRLLAAPAAVMRRFLTRLAAGPELAQRFGLSASGLTELREQLLVASPDRA
jgi:protein-tyrosine phosphatase